MLALRDDSPRPLSEKLLGHPLMLERIRAAIAGRAHRHLVPYTTTALERDLALELGIPMYAADPRHAHLGTKSGSRELFAAAGVARPLGIEHVHGVASAVEAIARLRLTKPGIAELVMKLDQGVSGDGNAIIDLRGLPAPGGAGERSRIRERIAAMALEADGVERDAYLAKLAARGGIVEERIVGEEIRSPSVQIQVTPAGAVEVLSTHDQLLGGESGQRYLGCRFPADPAYAVPVAELAERVGRRLAAAGVIGRSAIDFVVVRDGDGRWRPYAIELNLRKGGTTHPFVALQLLAGGGYDAGTGVYTAADGRRKHYVATDHLQAPELRALGRQGALEIAGRPDLRFDATRGWGVVPHMLSAVDELGRMGLTAIAGSAQEAQWLYERACSGLLEAGREAAAIGRRERARDGDVGQTGISEARR
jgi:hypothetical protein